MSLVRLIAVVAVVAVTSPIVVGQPAVASRPDDPAVLRNWPVAFESITRVAPNAFVGETDALSSAASHFIALVPCRVYDSRVVAGGAGPIPAATSRTIPVAAGPCAGIPPNAAGFSLNFTVTNSPPGSSYAFLTAYPAGSVRPNASTLNFMSGAQLANAAIVPAGTGGAIDVYVSQQTEVIIDINGYFAEGVVTNLTAGTGLSGGGSGSVSVGIANGGVGPAQLSAAGSTAGQMLSSTGTSVVWQDAAGVAGPAGGDLGGSYPNPSVAMIGGQTAANVASGVALANAATNSSSANTLVKRDASGNFAAATITGSLNGNATSATNFSGSLGGEVTGTQAATIVTNAVPANTPSAIVRRDTSGNFSTNSVTLSGAIALPASTSASTGTITVAGNPFAHSFGTQNTFLGNSAGNFVLTGTKNTAIGHQALSQNTTGHDNVANGFQALFSNTGGIGNMGIGSSALYSNTFGTANVALGMSALYSNTSGNLNVASGSSALYSNSTGAQNVAIGPSALYGNTIGSSNIGIGALSGYNLTAGDYNIDIGNQGFAAEANTIRIGTAGNQTRAFIAGIRGAVTAAGAVPVLVDSSGQLGTNGGVAPASTNTPNAIVQRDASGNFSAGTITATLNGSATNFSGSLGGEVTGTQGATVVTNAVATNTPNAIVRRDPSGNFSAGTVTLGGNLALPSTTSTSGAITIGGSRFVHGYGTANTFIGTAAGNVPPTGGYNTGVGFAALYSNTTGNANVAVGDTALRYCTSGNRNIAIGEAAGGPLIDGSWNIYIGASAANTIEDWTMRLGTDCPPGPGSPVYCQARTFIAGIRGVTTVGTAIPVLIDSNGQLGTASSSRRYKFDITDMGAVTDDLMRLRPVTFRYLAHGDRAPLQYGLIAEEVAEVYPQLVTRNADGQVDTVMYQFLAPMVLNELQKQHRTIEGQQETIDAQQKRIDAQQTMIDALTRRLEALERQSK